MLLKKQLIYFILLLFVVLAEEEYSYKEGSSVDTTVDSGDVNDENIKGIAKQLIQFIIDNYLWKLQSADITFEEKKEIFKFCFEKYFAVRKISGFILGKYVHEITPQDKESFVKYFTEQVTDMYTKQFDNFRNITVSVQSVEVMTVNRKNMYIVHTLINTDNTADTNDTIKLDWTCIIDNRDDVSNVKISDVSIAGISLRTTLRDVIQTEINDDFMNNVGEYIQQKSQIKKDSDSN